MSGQVDYGKAWAAHKATATTTPQQVHIGLIEMLHHDDPYAEFVRLINRALDYISQRMSRQKNVLQNSNEDQLTSNIIGTLCGMSFDATFESNNGGNCDITVEAGAEMVWLGEAKIYKSSGNLFGGFRQLIDRYASGLPNQDHGALIIYDFRKNAAAMMQTWRKRLLIVADQLSSDEPEQGSLDFWTSIPHAGTSRLMMVRHLAISLHHSPTDTLATPKWKAQEKAKIGLDSQ